MENLTVILQTLGLDDKEAAIYLAALELGSGTIQELAKKSGVTRTNVYNYISPVRQKGLLSEVVHGKKIMYIAEDPRKLVGMAEENLKKVSSALPEFMGLFNMPSDKPRVKFYDGVEGIRQAYEYYKQTEGPIYAVNDVESMMKVMPEEYMSNVAKDRGKRKVAYKMIGRDDKYGQLAKEKDKEQYRETRLVNKVTLGTEINIFDNKVIMFSFRRPPFAVVIEGNAIADTMRMMWRGWWDSLSKKVD